jgi:dTDP-4-amino-4,6-dideoxygalactose transaminase
MAQSIPLGRPYLSKELILEEIGKVLDTKWISGGPTIAKFEEALQDYIGGGYAVAVANGTVAIEMALIYLNKGQRYTSTDEVIVPSWSWVATGFAPITAGANPVWCDVNEYGVPTVETIERCITPRTKAIVIVHQMGVPCDLDAINALSEKYNIPVIEDTACGFGSEYKGKKLGNSRNICTFSLQARKCLTTGEGGFVTVRTKEEAEWFKSYRAFGTTVSPLERDRAKFLLKESFGLVASNYKISDITAAVGIAQLKIFNEEVALRNSAGMDYNALVTTELKGYAEVLNRVPDYCTKYNWQNYHILLDRRFNRDQVVDLLRKEGIGCKWDIQAIHIEPVFKGRYEDHKWLLLNTMKFHNHGLWLPFFAEITREEQLHVIDTLKSILQNLDNENKRTK